MVDFIGGKLIISVYPMSSCEVFSNYYSQIFPREIYFAVFEKKCLKAITIVILRNEKFSSHNFKFGNKTVIVMQGIKGKVVN